MQYAAHVPNGDFVKFFRKLLKNNLAAEYFPSLELHNNRIHYKNEQTGTLTQLESDSSTESLMNYLNPTLTGVEQQEIICSARMVHWAMNDPENVKLQISTAIDHFKTNMVSYSKRYNLNDVLDKVCLVVCDIRHQGRATSNDIITALNTNKDYEKAYKNLLTLGDGMHPNRIQTLRKTIDELVKEEKLGKKKYNQSKGDFN